MDERIREHAEILVDHSTDVQPGEQVMIKAAPSTEPMVIALHELLAERGAVPMAVDANARYDRAYLTSIEADEMRLAEHTLAAIESTDAWIRVSGDVNRFETADVPPSIQTAHRRTQQEVLNERLGTKWVGTQYPSPDAAQSAQMSTEAYADFVYEAVSKDWEHQREHQDQLVSRLEDATEVRIVSGDRTDLTLHVDGMVPINDHGRHNLPGGEVFTAPVVDAVEGTVHFDMPLIRHGREILDVYLEFKDGEVVDHAAAKNEELLTAILETDDGARRLGELGFGMNRDIDRFTYNMLFDEKMGDTIHLALGRAYEDNVPDDRERNESAVHVDMIVDMSEDSRIEFDGEAVQRDGRFAFEA